MWMILWRLAWVRDGRPGAAGSWAIVCNDAGAGYCACVCGCRSGPGCGRPHSARSGKQRDSVGWERQLRQPCALHRFAIGCSGPVMLPLLAISHASRSCLYLCIRPTAILTAAACCQRCVLMEDMGAGNVLSNARKGAGWSGGCAVVRQGGGSVYDGILREAQSSTRHVRQQLTSGGLLAARGGEES